MKARLIKSSFDGWNHYYLKNENGDTIGTTKHPFLPEMIQMAKGKGIELIRLSLKNCQTIELGYDLDELINESFDNMGYHSTVTPHEEKQFKLGYTLGFQKAFEILGDKNFTEEGLKQSLWDLGDVLFNNCQNGIKEGEPQKYINSIIQSLQQTEWDVIVEMECVIGCQNLILNGENSVCCGDKKPKISEDGCLILKRIEHA
jgi:hypothetical protein